MKTRRSLLYFVVLPICLIVSLWLLRFQIAALVLKKYAQNAKSQYLEAGPEKSLIQLSSTILDDAKVLSKFDIFTKNSAGRADAASFLNPRVSWPDKPGKLAIPPAAEDLVSSHTSFVSARPNWQKLKLDFSWMRELERFDFWAFDQSGPEYRGNDQFKVIDLPLPVYKDFILWAKLRLLDGRDRDDLANAFKEVHQLARLMMSNENIVGALSAIAILGIERSFYDSLPDITKDAIPLAIKQQIPTNPERDQAKRFYFAQRTFTDLRLSPDLFARLSRLTPGLCQRVSEAIENTIGYRRLLKGEMTEGFARVDSLILETQSQCRKSFLRQAWANPDYQGLFKSDDDIFRMATAGPESQPTPASLWSTTIKDLESNKILANAVVYTLLKAAQPAYLSQYERSTK